MSWNLELVWPTFFSRMGGWAFTEKAWADTRSTPRGKELGMRVTTSRGTIGDLLPSLIEMWEGEPAGGLSTLLALTARRFFTGPICFLPIYFPSIIYPPGHKSLTTHPPGHKLPTTYPPGHKSPKQQHINTMHHPPHINHQMQTPTTQKNNNNFFLRICKIVPL